MGTNILNIGKSALTTAELGIATAGHNIANSKTPGYNRQEVLQAANEAQPGLGGFVGQGSKVVEIKRVYNQYISDQVNSTQSSKNYADAYYTQIAQIDNLVADPTAGVSPALHDFFNAVQNLATTPDGTAGAASRQSILSTGESLVSRFQGLQTRLDDIRDGVNKQIADSVGNINMYAAQISDLNTRIERGTGATDSQPNDLLDQRDNLVTELSKLINVSVVPEGEKFNIFIGSGQSLVVGGVVNKLSPSSSVVDPSRIEISYESYGKTEEIPETSIAGGSLGGLFAFREKTLDVMQNSLGRVALGVATTFNDQHRLGQDLNGDLGTDFFKIGAPVSVQSRNNQSDANIAVSIVDIGALTSSDYRVKYDGSQFTITRISDGVAAEPTDTLPVTFDGISFDLQPDNDPVAGDEFLIHPTSSAVSGLGILISDTNKIAAGIPATTSIPSTNTGDAQISAGVIDHTYTVDSLTNPVTLSFSGNALTGFPEGSNLTVNVNGVETSYDPYSTDTPVDYTDGAKFNFSGVSFSIKGTPNDGDVFTISKNIAGSGDNRNALSLAKLQTSNTLLGNTTTFQGAFAQSVSLIGNKSQELKVVSAAESKLLDQAVLSQQTVSGVNLDEEAADLLRYQQAYQAAGKVMQIASQLFDTLLSIGR